MYKVSGYDDMCVDFEFVYDSFVEAIRAIRKLNDNCICMLMRSGKLVKYSTAWV